MPLGSCYGYEQLIHTPRDMDSPLGSCYGYVQLIHTGRDMDTDNP